MIIVIEIVIAIIKAGVLVGRTTFSSLFLLRTESPSNIGDCISYWFFTFFNCGNDLDHFLIQLDWWFTLSIQLQIQFTNQDHSSRQPKPTQPPKLQYPSHLSFRFPFSFHTPPSLHSVHIYRPKYLNQVDAILPVLDCICPYHILDCICPYHTSPHTTISKEISRWLSPYTLILHSFRYSQHHQNKLPAPPPFFFCHLLTSFLKLHHFRPAHYPTTGNFADSPFWSIYRWMIAYIILHFVSAVNWPITKQIRQEGR